MAWSWTMRRLRMTLIVTIEVQVTATDRSGDTATVDVVIMVNNVEEEGAFTFDKEFEYGNTCDCHVDGFRWCDRRCRMDLEYRR